MALRVLLADESQTIKKVIQLALQDYSVEVKPVHSGVDVLPIAKVFQPDIVFADVLLAKKSGYDVSRDLKNDPETKNIPVVLMWNSLMGIDERKAIDSMANKRLEKPFEVETLRQIVQELAPKTISNPISSFLNFGEIDSIRKDKNSKSTPPPLPNPKVENLSRPIIPENEIALNLEEEVLPEDLLQLEENEDFAQVSLHKGPSLPNENDDLNLRIDGEEDWHQQKISSIETQSPDHFLNTNNLPEKESLSIKIAELKKSENIQPQLTKESDLKVSKVNVTENFEEIIFSDNKESTGLPRPPSLNSSSHDSSILSSNFSSQLGSQLSSQLAPQLNSHLISQLTLDPMTQEKMIREEARVIIEKICWNIIPEITERIVREEIKKLLQETEK